MSETLGTLADLLYAKNKEIDVANSKVAELQSEKAAIEDRLLTAMKEANTDIVRTDHATISISEVIRAQIVDYDALCTFIRRHGHLHLFERRISAVAYREMKESRRSNDVPGLIDFVQQRLNVRKVENGKGKRNTGNKHR